jgi:hypothetical protein
MFNENNNFVEKDYMVYQNNNKKVKQLNSYDNSPNQ